MYDLYAISAGDSAEIVSAVCAVGVFLGMLFGSILGYVLRNEGRLSTIEEAVRTIQEKLDSNFQG